MKVQNARRWAPSGSRSWIMAAVALIIASAVRELLHPFFGPSSPGFAFCMAATLIAFYYGQVPALTVMAIGLCIADYLFVPPYGNITMIDRGDVILLVTYPVLTLMIIGLIERLRRAQYHSELIASVARSRYEILLRSDNERLIARRAADETHRLLRVLTQRHDELIFIQAVDTSTPAAHPDGLAASDEADVPATRLASGPVAVLPRSRDLPLTNATQPGSRFDDIHPDDIERVLTTLAPGTHGVRRLLDRTDYRLVNAICERFTTPAGDFFVLRLET